MLSRIVLLCTAATAAAAASGCGGAVSGTTVVASLYPLAFAAEQVAAADVRVDDLTPPGAEPHDLELTARDVGRLQKAALVLYVGHGFQPAVEDALDGLDPANVAHDAKTWELVVRKLRAGMMPPAGMKRPEPAAYDAMISSFEQELDAAAVPYTPAPGLHRLNRTEYANVVRDLLDLPIDAAKYLPSDDSTSGFESGPRTPTCGMLGKSSEKGTAAALGA